VLTLALLLAAGHLLGGTDSLPGHRLPYAGPGPSRDGGAGRWGAGRNATVLENAREGTSDWRLPTAESSRAIEGFADRVSIDGDGTFRLFVNSAEPWDVRAYRLGWYGGRGGRLLWTSSWNWPSPQPAALTSSATGTVRAPWRASLTVHAQHWPAGMYLLKLTTAGDQQSYVPLTVRSPSMTGRTVFVTSDLTLQAYNQWGGSNLYRGPDGDPETRALAVSFDRPYDPRTTTRIMDTEQPLIAEAEQLGIPMAYVSDVDVATRPGALAGARAVVVDGHDEYWTSSERAAVLAARDRGTNLMFFGANQMWWRVDLAATGLGPDRLVRCNKRVPRRLPAQAVIGVHYAGLGARAPFVVADPGFFAFRNTGAQRGSAYPGLVGPEIDAAGPPADRPSGLDIVAHSIARCRYGGCWSDSTYYVAASGAGVWAAGTMGWVDALGQGRLRLGATARTKDFVRVVTANLLTAFAAGPAGRMPATPASGQ
jgi:hypothetical protein